MIYINSHHPAILGENNANFPKLASILAQAISSDLEFEDGLEALLISSLKAILQVSPMETSTLLPNIKRLPILESKLNPQSA
jgi:hypothetical protein